MVSTGDGITASQHNVLRGLVGDVIETKYGQVLLSHLRPAGQTIDKSAIEGIWKDIARQHWHQTGSHNTLAVSVPEVGYTYGADATVKTGAGQIISITKAILGLVTVSEPHGLQTGMGVTLNGVGGMTNLNGNQYIVTVVDATKFTIPSTNNYSLHEPSTGTYTITNATISNSIQMGFNDYLSAVIVTRAVDLPDTTIASNYDIATLHTSTPRTTAWGNSVDIITHEVTVTFNTGGNYSRTRYFEAGGQIWFNAGISGGTNTTGSKYASWNELIATIGTVKFGRDVTTNGTITDTDGYTDLSLSSYKEIFKANAGAGVYAENDYNIQAKLVSSNKIQFLIEFRDDDAGDQQDVPTGEIGPAGAAEDEDVGGTTTSVVKAYVPNSAFTYNGSSITAVYFPPPTAVANSQLQ